MSGNTLLEIVEFTDPACAWAWGSEPGFLWLRAAIGEQASWRRVFGILFDDDDDEPPDWDAETAHYVRWLAGVSTHTRAPYPFRLQRVARTSWPSSVVAKAAERQSPAVAERVLRRLRECTFVDGSPPDTLAAALQGVRAVRGVAHDQLRRDAESAAIRELVRADWEWTRKPDPALHQVSDVGPHCGRPKLAQGRYRHAFPTLRLQGPAGEQFVPGWRPREEYIAALRTVAPEIELRPVRFTAGELLSELGSLTAVDLSLLTDGGPLPSDAVHVETHNGGLWRAAPPA